jgi:probable rRNA maturation factor
MIPNKYISITIAGDKEVQDLNKKHLGRDTTTDVLSFPVNEVLEDGTDYLGDIVVNSEQAARQMSEYDNDLEHEIAELVSHGVLHLLGVHHPHDDEDETHEVKRSK